MGKSEGSLKVSKSVQNWLDSPGQYTDSGAFTVPLRQGPCMPVAFVVGWMVLHWGNIHATISAEV